jgi:hypothetical protein
LAAAVYGKIIDRSRNRNPDRELLLSGVIEVTRACLDHGIAVPTASQLFFDNSERERIARALFEYLRDRSRPGKARALVPRVMGYLQCRLPPVDEWLLESLSSTKEAPEVQEEGRKRWAYRDPALLRRLMDEGQVRGSEVPEVGAVYDGAYEERGVLWEYAFQPGLAACIANRVHHDTVLRHLEQPDDVGRAACAAYLVPTILHWHPELRERFDRALEALETDTRTHSWVFNPNGMGDSTITLGKVAESVRAGLAGQGQ